MNSRVESLPNLIVGGAQKCGTTSLHQFLKSHPDIFFPESPQEIHYFDIDENYRRGLDHYRDFFRDQDGQKIIGQTSPLYLYESKVAERIHRDLDAVKFIFILRNPVERAYSHYWHEIRYGYETKSFEEALKLESIRVAKDFACRRHFSYVGRGFYAEQLQRFYSLFPRHDILVIKFEEFLRKRERVADQCARFLGIDPDGFDTRNIERHNRARLPVILGLQQLVRPLRNTWAGKLARVVDRVNLRYADYPEMASETRARLQGAFHDDICSLESLTGLILDNSIG